MYHQTLPAGAAAAADAEFAPHAAGGILAYMDDPKITLKTFMTKTFHIPDYHDMTIAQQKQHMQRLFDLFVEMKKIWKIKSIDINIIIDITSHAYTTLLRDAIAKTRSARPSTRTTAGAEKSSATDR